MSGRYRALHTSCRKRPDTGRVVWTAKECRLPPAASPPPRCRRRLFRTLERTTYFADEHRAINGLKIGKFLTKFDNVRDQRPRNEYSSYGIIVQKQSSGKINGIRSRRSHGLEVKRIFSPQYSSKRYTAILKCRKNTLNISHIHNVLRPHKLHCCQPIDIFSNYQFG